MRVVAGQAGGLRLKAVPGRGTRPTTDRVKESVFGILGQRCLGARVLDLFAGTGSLGIEALSRGADRAVLVERDRAALRVLRENLESTGFTAQAEVWPRDVLSVLADAGRREVEKAGAFDLVFVDPPYGSGLAEVVVRRLGESGCLAPEAVVVAEHSNHQALPDRAGTLVLRRRQRYGETVVSFYSVAAPDEPQTAVSEAGEREQ